MKLDRPAEALHVDHVDQHHRQGKAHHQPNPLAHRADQGGFDDHHLAHLVTIGAGQPQQRQLAPPLEHQRQERARHAEHGHDDGDQFEGVGDGERAVEDAEHLVAQGPVAEDERAVTLVHGREDLATDLLRIRVGREERGNPGRGERAEIVAEGARVHDHDAAVVGVVVVDGGDAEVAHPFGRWQRQRVAIALVKLVRERFGNDHRVMANRLADRIAGSGRALEQQRAAGEHDIKRARAEDGEMVLVDHVEVAEAVDGLHRRMPLHGGDDVGRQRLFLAHRRPDAGADEQVGLQRLSHPVDHRVAEAADHDRDGDHHREAHRQRGDGNRQAGNGRREVGMCEQAFDAEATTQEHPAGAREAIHDGRHQQARTDHDRKRCQVAEQRPSVDRTKLRESEGQHQHRERCDQHRRTQALPHIERVVAAHGGGGFDPAGFERGNGSGQQREGQADGSRQPHMSPIHVRGRRGGGDVDGADRGRGHAHRHIGQQPRQAEAEPDAREREHRGFAEKEQQHLAARQAKRAQRADVLPAGDHRNRYGVVDQEQADDQRDPRQGRQVGVERREHGFHLLAAARRPLCRQSFRHASGNRRERGGQVGAVREQHVEPVDPAQAIEGELRGGNVHQHEVAIEHARRTFVLQQPADDVRDDPVAEHHLHLAPDREAAPLRQLLADHHRPFVGQDLEELLGRDLRPARPA